MYFHGHKDRAAMVMKIARLWAKIAQMWAIYTTTIKIEPP